MKKIQVAIVVTYTYPYIGNGLGNVAIKQAEYLARGSHGVTLISSKIPFSKASFVKNGVLHLKQKASAVLERLNLPVPLFVLNREARSAVRNADVVHIHDILYPTSLFAVIIAKWYKKPVIVTVHILHVKYDNPVLDFIEHLVTNTMGRYILSRSDAIVTVNKTFIASSQLSKYRDKLFYLPNGVDTELFTPATEIEKQRLRATHNFPTNRPIILFVGRFVSKKGFELLLKAQSRRAGPRGPDYVIILIGDTKRASYVNNADVLILGTKSNHELADFYKLSDLFILPSHGEGFALSIQEAMASGLPTITTKENIPLENGSDLAYFIDLDTQDIRRAIDFLLHNPAISERLSANARRFTVAHFSWEENVNSLREIYEECIDAKTKSVSAPVKTPQ